MNVPFIACAVVYLAILLLKASGAMIAAWSQRSAVGSADWRGRLTIVQPILAGDARLTHTLERNVVVLHDASFLWLVDEDDKTGREVTADIARRHPDACIAIVVCPAAPDGANPKTFKLDLALTRVETDLLLVLDDDATLDAQALARLIAGLAHADIATALPYYAHDVRWPEQLLAQFIDNNAASTYLALLPVTPAFALNGMCYVTRADALEASGGFAPIVHELADDLALARRLRHAGWTIAQTTAPVAVATTIESWTAYFRQMHRWFLFGTLLFVAERPAIKAAILALHVVPPLALSTITIIAVTSLRPALMFVLLAIYLMRSIVLVALQRLVTGRSRHAFVASLLSELLQPLHLVHAFALRKIRWRKRHYRVAGDANFHPVAK